MTTKTYDKKEVDTDDLPIFTDDTDDLPIFTDEKVKKKDGGLPQLSASASVGFPTGTKNTPQSQSPSGLVEQGNIDLAKQPSVKNTETGGMSTVFSTGIEEDGKEVLISRVTPDGKFMSEKEARDYYHKTGKHLGKFKDATSATEYAIKLHEDYESGKISPITSPLDVEAIFSFNRGKKKEPIPANSRNVDIDSIAKGVAIGDIEPDELSTAYNSVFGKATVEKIISEFAPDLGTEGWGHNTFKKEWKWDELAKRIKTKNRINAKVGKEAYSKIVDDELTNASQNLKTVQANINVSSISGAGTGIAASEIPIPSIDINNPSEYSSLIQQLKDSDKVVDKNGNEVVGAKEKLLKVLEQKAKSITAEQGIDKEISDIPNDKIANAIARSNLNREFGENIPIEEFAKNDKQNEEHFKLGLSYIKKVKYGQYKNVLRIIDEGKEIPDDDFRNISQEGQKIYNEQVFFNAASNPELIDKETSLDYTTHSDKKAQYAATIGERLKKTSGLTRKEYKEDEIKKAAYDLPNKKIVQELADEEKLFGYDAIPKTGPIEALVRGFNEPFFGILSTLQTIGESPVETYIRSKKLDTGSAQKVPDAKGNLSAVLPSDRGNIFYDAVNGAGQFLAQVALTRGIGGGLAKAISADARIALTPALKSGIINYAGTSVSTFMQTWGDSYADYLAKTGDYATARLGATVDAGFASVWELWLPESKIADRALSPLRRKLATDIIDLAKKGGDPATLAKKGRSFIEKAVTGVANIVGQEVLEEVGTQGTDWLTEYVFSPQTAKDRDLGKEIIETVKATAVQTIIPAIFGGGGSAFNKDFTQNGFHSAAINFNDYKQVLDKQLNNNVINQDDYNSAVKLLSTHKESISSAPKQDINGKEVESQKQLDYALEETKIKVNKEKAEQSTGVAKKMYEQRIKESEDIQTSILMPPTKEGDINKSKTQSDASLQEDQKRDQKTGDTQTVQPEGDGLSEGQGTVRQETLTAIEGAAENVVPSTLTVENQRVDIEKRRQDELSSKKYIQNPAYVSEHLVERIKKGNEVVMGDTKEKVEDDINAKYDAELKALEQPPQPQSKPADVVQAGNKLIPNKKTFEEGDTFPYWDNDKWVTVKIEGKDTYKEGEYQWLIKDAATDKRINVGSGVPESVINKYIDSYNKEQSTQPQSKPADVVPSGPTQQEIETSIKAVGDTRQTELKAVLKPNVDLSIDDIDPNRIAQHDDGIALKDEVIKIDDEIKQLKQLATCIYG